MPTHEFGDAKYGVDYATPPHMLERGMLADASNVVLTDAGLITGRSGSVKYNATSMASRVTSFHEFRSGSTRNQLCSITTKVNYFNSGTGEFVESITGLTTGKMLQWVNFAGKAICVNEGSDAPQYWTDSATKGALAGSPPTGLTICEWANRLWFGGDAAQGARLTGSAINDPTDYTGAAATASDAIQTTVGDSGDTITGIFGFFDMLLIGKKNNIYRAVGDPPTDVTTLDIKPLYSKSSDSVGFTSPWAITQVGNDVIFLDGFDIKRISGIEKYGDVEYISIIPHFRDFLKATVSKDYLQYAQFFHYKKAMQVWVTIPKTATTHYVFVLDYKFKEQTGRYSFFPMGSIEAVCFGGVEDGEVVNIYYGDETGYVHQLDVGNDDNGAAISRYVVTVVSGNYPENGVTTGHEFRKQFHNVEAFIDPLTTTLTMAPYYGIDLMYGDDIRTSGNYSNEGLSAEVVSAWTGTGVKHKRIRFHGLCGNTFALKWLHSTVAQNFTIFPSSIEYTRRSKNLIE